MLSRALLHLPRENAQRAMRPYLFSGWRRAVWGHLPPLSALKECSFAFAQNTAACFPHILCLCRFRLRYKEPAPYGCEALLQIPLHFAYVPTAPWPASIFLYPCPQVHRLPGYFFFLRRL